MFTRPTHGEVGRVTALNGTSPPENRVATRFFLSDKIPFRSHVRFSLQHGPVDTDPPVTSARLAYYYWQSKPRITRSDSLVIGDDTSESTNSYTVTGQTFAGSRTYSFGGEHNVTPSSSRARLGPRRSWPRHV
jgi:hypothetical protein